MIILHVILFQFTLTGLKWVSSHSPSDWATTEIILWSYLLLWNHLICHTRTSQNTFGPTVDPEVCFVVFWRLVQTWEERRKQFSHAVVPRAHYSESPSPWKQTPVALKVNDLPAVVQERQPCPWCWIGEDSPSTECHGTASETRKWAFVHSWCLLLKDANDVKFPLTHSDDTAQNKLLYLLWKVGGAQKTRHFLLVVA